MNASKVKAIAPENNPEIITGLFCLTKIGIFTKSELLRKSTKKIPKIIPRPISNLDIFTFSLHF